MNLIKHREFFNPENITNEIHIIGCGAVGSTIIEQLTRLGVAKLHIYDLDKVSEHNITNQMFFTQQIGAKKTLAITSIAKLINPDIKIISHGPWKAGTPLAGYVFLAVDNIETRQAILKDNLHNTQIKYVFDTRMRLTDAQHFAASWDTDPHKAFLLETMHFTAEEAQAATPVSACGTSLSVTPTVRLICSIAVVNFINACLNKPIKKTILLDAFELELDAFQE